MTLAFEILLLIGVVGLAGFGLFGTLNDFRGRRARRGVTGRGRVALIGLVCSALLATASIARLIFVETPNADLVASGSQELRDIAEEERRALEETRASLAAVAGQLSKQLSQGAAISPPAMMERALRAFDVEAAVFVDRARLPLDELSFSLVVRYDDPGAFSSGSARVRIYRVLTNEVQEGRGAIDLARREVLATFEGGGVLPDAGQRPESAEPLTATLSASSFRASWNDSLKSVGGIRQAFEGLGFSRVAVGVELPPGVVLQDVVLHYTPYFERRVAATSFEPLDGRGPELVHLLTP